MLWSFVAAAALAADPAGSTVTKAAADAQCKAGQSAPVGKVGDWTGGLHDAKGGLTPATVPGATRVSVDELNCLGAVYGGRLVGLTPIEERESGIPGTWRIDRGWEAGDFKDDVQTLVKRQLHYTVGTDLDRPVVVYCHNTYCFMSYNLALRAAMLGYRNIYWLRGGMEEWQGKGGKPEPLMPAIAAVGDEANTVMTCVVYSTVLAELKVITDKQYAAYTDAIAKRMESLVHPARGDLYQDKVRLMEENLGGAFEIYAELLKNKNPDAVEFRKEHFANFDKACGSLPGAQKGMFPI